MAVDDDANVRLRAEGLPATGQLAPKGLSARVVGMPRSANRDRGRCPPDPEPVQATARQVSAAVQAGREALA